MASVQTPAATLEDLARVTEKAELIDGRIVPLMPIGRKPGRVAGRIYRSLDDYATQTGRGEAYPDNAGFTVPRLSSGRQSFAPDASYYLGPFPDDPMRFLEGPPTLAIEARSENDYTPSAAAELAAKRADYFEAGTRIVWDVDLVAECIHVYRAEAPAQPTTFRRGQVVDAEPLLPGWRIDVDWIFA
ncbi:MAG TPA: Uma2 family endonuclease [Isosphaeraceae bacterium]|nr:Uma2 family endonuclease [Isosphaeraceae bacterium]